MKCLSQSQIDDYVKGKLKGNKVRLFKEHLKGCPACRAELTLTQRICLALKLKPRFPPPTKEITVVDKVLKRLPQRRPVWDMAAPRHKPKKKGKN